MAQQVDAVQRRLAKDPGFRLWSRIPPNGEPPSERLADSTVTPLGLFYVRCHGEIPVVDADAHRLVVDGLVERPLELGLAELRERFAAADTLATLQCAGNRRTELAEIAPIPGETPWREAAIGTARWRGVRLRDVLEAAHVRPEARHVELVGLDPAAEGETTATFGGSIPLEYALASPTVLALEMNGEPLRPAHGHPLRAVVPGYIGARSVKWLARVTLRTEPSANHFHARSYKVFPPDVRAQDADWSAAPPLGEAPLNCAICRTSSPGPATVVEGWACAGGDRTVTRVEVSADGGASWSDARFDGDAVPGAWRLWRAALVLGPGEHELVARAWDSTGATQPESAAALWNFKGYANNAWHRVRTTVS